MNERFFDMTEEEVEKYFDTSSEAGLTSREARKRLRFFGQNKIYGSDPQHESNRVLSMIFSPAGLVFYASAVACIALHILGAVLAAAIWTVAMVVLGTFLFGAYTLFVIIYLAFEERKISSCFKNLGVEYFATCEYLKQHGCPWWDPHGEHVWDAADAKRLVEYLEDYRPNQTQMFEFQIIKERF